MEDAKQSALNSSPNRRGPNGFPRIDQADYVLNGGDMIWHRLRQLIDLISDDSHRVLQEQCQYSEPLVLRPPMQSTKKIDLVVTGEIIPKVHQPAPERAHHV